MADFTDLQQVVMLMHLILSPKVNLLVRQRTTPPITEGDSHRDSNQVANLATRHEFHAPIS